MLTFNFWCPIIGSPIFKEKYHVKETRPEVPLAHHLPSTLGRARSFFDANEIILEIQHGEGGDDSKIFVDELFSAYLKYAQSLGFKAELLLSQEGHIVAQICGSGVGKAFCHESGKHVVQRVPPTESNGRRQTSVISVGVLPIPPDNTVQALPEHELEITTTKGTGPGGQNKNKVESAVRIVHLPTKISVFIDGRDQGANKREARRIITARVNEVRKIEANAEYAAYKRKQMGDGGRGDKVRTYNFICSRVVDHRLGTKTGDIKGVMKGNFKKLLGN